jgi:hypothetical protein
MSWTLALIQRYFLSQCLYEDVFLSIYCHCFPQILKEEFWMKYCVCSRCSAFSERRASMCKWFHKVHRRWVCRFLWISVRGIGFLSFNVCTLVSFYAIQEFASVTSGKYFCDCQRWWSGEMREGPSYYIFWIIPDHWKYFFMLSILIESISLSALTRFFSLKFFNHPSQHLLSWTSCFLICTMHTQLMKISWYLEKQSWYNTTYVQKLAIALARWGLTNKLV